MPQWTIQKARETYSVTHWSDGYFDIAEDGHVIANPLRRAGGPVVDIHEVVDRLAAQGMPTPVLIRFVDILHDRARALRQAFATAMAADSYRGRYTAVYPVKVNQQRCVIEELLASGNGEVGLEAGSKPELMIVLALSDSGGRIICNGYKDREYVRLALIGQQMGFEVFIVIEKMSELELVLAEARALGVTPLLGVRMRLASIGKGKWQNTGGEKAKFGLSASQLLVVLERLRSSDMRAALKLLHVHLGSQIANIRDIQRGMREVARYYAELRRLGAEVTCVDVGGGLGVDYEGTRSRNFCSMNYSLQEYANNVVHTLWEACDELGLPHPDIISESGRAMTAHHAVLVTNVIDCERVPDGAPEDRGGADEPPVITDLRNGLEQPGDRNALEVYHDAVHAMATVQDMYTHGLLTLQQRARAEQLYFATCRRVHPRLQAASRIHREVLDELNEKLADKFFCNLSVFQSLPDVWAINQIFPIMPLHRLDERPARRAVIADITCDSDGRIDLYVDSEGIESTLPLHEIAAGERYLLGIFLVGAYQEILGDMHNLFGDTHAVNVVLDADGGYHLDDLKYGEGVDRVLHHVDFEAASLLERMQARMAASGLPRETQAQLLETLAAGLKGYTYLED